MGQQQFRRIVFTNQEKARVEPAQTPEALAPDAVLVRNHWTLISPGTELALYTNQHDINGRQENAYPIYPGYAAAGVVEKAGPAVQGFQPGDRVLTLGSHAAYSLVRPSASLCVKVPDGLELEYAPFARMALITLATLANFPYLAGEWLGVVGLGLVGNLGAQFGRLAGCRVVGFGRSPARSQIARQCSIHVLDAPGPQEAGAAVRELSGGVGCRLVLETSGTAAGLVKSIAVAEDGGTISLIGVPWLTEADVSISEVMQPVFSRYLKIQGGWEWGLPMHQPEPKTTHLLPHRNATERNAQYALYAMGQGHIQIEPLISARVQPDDIQEAYQSLLSKERESSGILIDWRSE
jgi:threonine dehydrogenase-like Zn-dependent dehydrogenase